MPLTAITVPTFPFVPFAAGVPNLVRAAADVNLSSILTSAAAGNPPLIFNQMLTGGVPSMLNGILGSIPQQLSSDLTSVASTLAGDLGLSSPLTGDKTSNVADNKKGPQWGIFDSSNKPVIPSDNVMAVGYMTEYRISKYPVEQGGFESYNKVAAPFDAQVALSQGGTVAERTAFVQAIETAKASLDLYSVVTPEYTYQSANIIHADYDRKAEDGATLITAYIHLEEVRVTATATYSNTAAPSGAGQQQDGTVQATTPNATQAGAASTGAN